MFVIDESTDNDLLFPGEFGRGAVPRDLSADPPDLFAPPSEIPLIPRSEWDARIKEQEERRSSLSHLRTYMANGQSMASLDQNGQGYCWAYSTTATVMFARAVAGLPHARLSAHAVGCMVKGFRDEGGWCGLSAKFIRERGVPSVQLWPEKSMSRGNDKPDTWADAAKYKIVSDWVDLTRPVHSQNLTFDQIAACLLTNRPVALDFAWWGHSVCGLRLVRVEAGSYGIEIINSWTDGWGERGLGVLRGSRAQPMGAVCTRMAPAA